MDPYINMFDGLNENPVCFWHSNETSPFLTVHADTIVVYSDRAEVYGRDYASPIATIREYDFWTMK